MCFSRVWQGTTKIKFIKIRDVNSCKCCQVPPVQQPMVGVGSLQPPVFPGPIGMPPPSFPPGVPPPPFIRPGFNPMQMPPGSTSYSCCQTICHWLLVRFSFWHSAHSWIMFISTVHCGPKDMFIGLYSFDYYSNSYCIISFSWAHMWWLCLVVIYVLWCKNRLEHEHITLLF